jgi:hypothetical protein
MKRLLVVLLLLSSCRRAEPRPDARAIVRAYEAFQSASPTDRPAALQSLESAPCTDTPTCADRDACVGYARHLSRAQELTRKARELGPEDAGGSGAATESELAIIVSGADDETKAASAAEPKCRTALERLYALAR